MSAYASITIAITGDDDISHVRTWPLCHPDCAEGLAQSMSEVYGAPVAEELLTFGDSPSAAPAD